MRLVSLRIIHAVASGGINQEEMGRPRALRNRPRLAVELAQRLSESIGIARQLHGRRISEIFSLTPQERHAGLEHAEGEEPQRELDGKISQENRKEQEITNGAKH